MTLSKVQIIRIAMRVFATLLMRETKVPSTSVVSILSRLNKTVVGSYCYISSFCSVRSATLGNYCSVGPGVVLGAISHENEITTSFRLFDPAPEVQTVIHDDVWLGANCVILSGVTIGRGAIIGAGSIVTRDIPAYSVAVGVPARVARKRFSDKQISEIERSKYWLHPPSEAKKILAEINRYHG